MKNKPLIIGLTGGIGSGKTTVAGIFSGKFGIPVYHADDRAKELMHTPSLRKQIEKLFGEKSYENGRLNREFLASIVFNDRKALDKLEKIVHPVVQKDFKKWITRQQTPYVLLENAILFESGMNRLCDYIIFVDADKDLRIKRLKKRNNWSDAQIEARMKNQQTEKEKLKKSHYVIKNNNKIDDILKDIERLNSIFTRL
jgi:dephospho-CoA kinase